jgi:hypothetical protein
MPRLTAVRENCPEKNKPECDQRHIYHQVLDCPCESGCPSCVGPEVELGYGGKNETIALLKAITE